MVLLHELTELAELVVVVPTLSELVTFDEVFELVTFDDTFELDTFELTDDDGLDLIELFAPPEVVALTVPDPDVIELEAACDST
jgi:hypothetical protein